MVRNIYITIGGKVNENILKGKYDENMFDNREWTCRLMYQAEN